MKKKLQNFCEVHSLSKFMFESDLSHSAKRGEEKERKRFIKSSEMIYKINARDTSSNAI